MSDIPSDFDWQNYVKLNEDLKDMDKTQAISHYKKHGVNENRIYNTNNIPDNFNWKTYLKLNNDLNFTNEIDCVRHYLQHGIKDNRQFKMNLNHENNLEKNNVALDKFIVRNEIDHNIYYDCVYIINLKKNKINLLKSKFQLKKNNFLNYKFISAVNGKDKIYNKLYDLIIAKLDPIFVKHNLQRGALGCYLSHINCILDAKKNNYSKILILEDDFIIVNNYNFKITELMENINNNWDFVYFGKKQLHFDNIKNVNNFVYMPDKNTYATHALYIKNTIFDDILSFKYNINSPIDIKLQSLYSCKNIYSIYSDLFIADDSVSDIQQELYKTTMSWGWEFKNYNKINHINIENIIVFGFKKNTHHTHNYIHKMYYKFFKYYFKQINVYFYDEEEIDENFVINNTIIFCSPTHCLYKKYIKGINNYYIFHLDNYDDNVGYNSLGSFFSDKIVKELIQSINGYVVLLCRENNSNSNLKYFESNLNSKEICLPWFSDKLYLDIKNLDIELLYNTNSTKKYYAYIGSIWSDNITLIKKLIKTCTEKKIYLLLTGRKFGLNYDDNILLNTLAKKNDDNYVIFRPFDYKNDKYNSLKHIVNNYSVKTILTLQGENKDIYISNRVFENISMGYIGITNSPIVKNNFKSIVYFDDNKIEEMFDNLNKIFSDKNMFCELLHKQFNEFISKFYGYNAINNIIDFLKQIEYNNNTLLTICNNVPFKLWFCCDNNYENKYFKKINNNYELTNITINPCDLIITNDGYLKCDKFIIQTLLLNINCELFIDEDFIFYDEIINVCKKYEKLYDIKNKLNKCVLVSGQRTGSTLILDYIQKLSHNTIALSEIFNYYEGYDEVYSSSYDITNEYGILHDTILSDNFIKLTEDNSFEYLKQFEDYAIYQNKEIFLFKLTIDFTKNINEFIVLDKVMDAVKNYNIIYLHRDDNDSLNSKKMADIYGYSNVQYPKNASIKIYDDEIDNFIENKKHFYYKYLKNLIHTSISYKWLTTNETFDNVNELLYKITKKHSLDKELYEIILKNTTTYFNIKQQT